jgi:CelD/BcsL family acetyltransferase involved in cellulose biosynthesis
LSKIELVTDPERFQALKPEWDALWLRCRDGGIFQSFDCCLKIWQSIAAPEGRKLLCLVGWDNGRLIAVWPLVTYRRLAWKFVRPLEANDSEFSDILIDDAVNQRDWTRAAWQVLRTKSRSDFIILPYFLKGSAINDILDADRTSVDHNVAVHVPLAAEADWESYYNSLSKSHRRDHGKSRRRLAALGTIGYEVIDAGDPRGPELVQWMMSQKRLWAERTNKKGSWLYADGFHDFLTRLVTDSAATPACLMMCLTLDRAPIAIQIYAAGQHTLQAMISGFDARYEKYSPGILLSEGLMKWAMHHKVDCDLGLGAEQYKKFWSRNSIVETTSYHITVSWWGSIALWCRSLIQKR